MTTRYIITPLGQRVIDAIEGRANPFVFQHRVTGMWCHVSPYTGVTGHEHLTHADAIAAAINDYRHHATLQLRILQHRAARRR